MCTTRTLTTVERWSLRRTVPGAERAGKTILKQYSALNTTLTSPLTVVLSACCSLGCGIGYGYLHRIPTRPFEEGKKISFPGNSPSEPVSPLKDGFTEVRTMLD